MATGTMPAWERQDHAPHAHPGRHPENRQATDYASCTTLDCLQPPEPPGCIMSVPARRVRLNDRPALAPITNASLCQGVQPAGPGSGFPEEPVCGVQVGRAGCRAVPLLPSRALGVSGGAAGIGLEAGEDGVADLPLQRSQGLFGGLALGQLLVVAGAALAVPVADLGDRGHVDGVAVPAVPAPAQPVDNALPGGHLDRRGAVAGGEVVPAGKTGHVADVTDDRSGYYRANPGQAGQASPGRLDRGGQLFPGLADPGVDAAQVLGEGCGR